MRKPQKHPKRPKDVSEWKHQIVQQSTHQETTASVEPIPEVVSLPSPAQISALMAEMGRRGGLIGGKRRLETMTKAQRSKAASKAAKARWENFSRQ